MIRRPPRSTLSSSSAASDVYKRQAAPYHLAVGICGVPHLLTEKSAAVAAYQLRGKYAASAVNPAESLSSGNFRLHHLPIDGADNGVVAVFHIVLWDFALVDLHLFHKEVHGEPFLQKGIALVFFVGKDTVYPILSMYKMENIIY